MAENAEKERQQAYSSMILDTCLIGLKHSLIISRIYTCNLTISESGLESVLQPIFAGGCSRQQWGVGGGVQSAGTEATNRPGVLGQAGEGVGGDGQVRGCVPELFVC